MTDITNSGFIPEKRTVCALGLFDGVHRGHQLIITTAVKKAQSLGGHSAVFCFKTDTVTSKGHDGRIEMLMSDYGWDPKYPSPYTEGSSVDGFICMGTGSMPEYMLQIGRLVLELEKSQHGERYRSTLMEVLAFGTYNRGIPKTTIVDGEVRKRTNKDWVSRDPKRVDAYVDDPLCQFSFTLKGYETLFNTCLLYTSPSPRDA